MPLKPLKSLEPSKFVSPFKGPPPPAFKGRTPEELRTQTACAWFVRQRAAFQGALTPLFAMPGDQDVIVKIDQAVKDVARAVGLGRNSLKYIALMPFLSYTLFDRAMAMDHCRMEVVLEFEWEELSALQFGRRRMSPEAKVIDGLVQRLCIPPQMAKMLADVALEATWLMAQRTTEHARAVDTETYRELGHDALLTGDSRAALAAQRALTVTQGSAKSSGGSPLTLDQIFQTMRELDSSPLKDPVPLSLTSGPTEGLDDHGGDED